MPCAAQGDQRHFSIRLGLDPADDLFGFDRDDAAMGDGNKDNFGGWSPTFFFAKKMANLIRPGPSMAWLFVDEHPDSINDAGAFPPDRIGNIPDAPATYHNGAAGFAFADGHSEIHKWRGPTMTKPRSARGLKGVNFVAENNFATTSTDPDVIWYTYVSPRWTTKTVVGP